MAQSRIARLLKLIEVNALGNIGNLPDAESIKAALTSRLSVLDYESIMVDDVSVDTDGNIVVDFSDGENTVSILFRYETDGVQAVLMNSDDTETMVFDLDPLNPSVVNTAYGVYVNLSDVSWLNRSTVGALLFSGLELDDEEEEDPVQQDAFGNVITAPAEARQVRQGKRKLRAPVLASKKRHTLSAAIQAAYQRLPKKERKHALKCESAMPQVSVFTTSRGQYQVLVKTSSDPEFYGLTFEKDGSVKDPSEISDDDIENTHNHVPNLMTLPSHVRDAIIAYVKDRMS